MKKLLKHIEGMNIADKDKALLTEIFQNNQSEGLLEDSERMRILKASLQFLGNSYLRTEELAQNTVDCSTLTSQSYWEGAQIGIPFIAESQRVAADGIPVTKEEALPADIVVRFAGLEASPDKTYNHVGLILGRGSNGTTYVIESNSKEGCVISTLEKFDPQGGFRRYLKNDNVLVDDGLYADFNAISKKVPKLSRLGARQYKTDAQERPVHRGIDIYVELDTPVHAPIPGVVSVGVLHDEREPCIFIEDKDGLKCTLGNAIPEASLIGQTVREGQVIGKIHSPSNDTQMKYPDMKGCVIHLHFQIEGQVQTDKVLNKIKVGDKTYYNGIYMAKLGLIKLPVKP